MTRSPVVHLHRHFGLLLLLTAAAFTYASTLSSYGMFMWDEAEYASIARSLLRDEGFAIGGQPNALRPPVLPLAGAASMWLTGSANDASAKYATLVFALLALTIVYAATAVSYDKPTAVAAALLLATLPEFWAMTANFLSEIPFLAFFSGAVLWFDLGLRRNPRYLCLSWPCFALALLTRYTAVSFALFVVLRLLFGLLVRRHDEWPRIRTREFVLAPMFAALLIAPWLLRQQAAFSDFLIGFKAASAQLQVYIPGVSMPWYFYLERLPETLSPATTGLLLSGVAWGVWRRHETTLVCTSVIVGLLLWFSAYRFKEVRLVTSILPFVAVVAAAGPTQFLLESGRRAWGVWVAAVIGALLIAWNATLVTPRFATRITIGYPSLLQAAKFLKEHSTARDVVMTASIPQVAWYADRRVVPIPEEANLKVALASTDWTLLTSFERGQAAYATDLARQMLSINAPTQVFTFHDQRFAVVLVRSRFLRDNLR